MGLRGPTGGRRVKVFHQDLFSLLGTEAEDAKSLQQVVVNRAAGEAGDLDLDERKKSEDMKFTYFLPWPPCFSVRLDL